MSNQYKKFTISAPISKLKEVVAWCKENFGKPDRYPETFNLTGATDCHQDQDFKWGTCNMGWNYNANTKHDSPPELMYVFIFNTSDEDSCVKFWIKWDKICHQFQTR